MILVWCAFNELHGITSDRVNNDSGDNFWYTDTIIINVITIEQLGEWIQQIEKGVYPD